MDRKELIKRVEYILDPTATAGQRLSRRAHLTNHDLRAILAALREQPSEGRSGEMVSARGMIRCGGSPIAKTLAPAGPVCLPPSTGCAASARGKEQAVMDRNELANELDAAWKTLAGYGQSDFANVAAGEYGEDLMNKLVGLLSRSADALREQPSDAVSVLAQTLAECEGVTSPGPGFMDDAKLLHAALAKRGWRLAALEDKTDGR